MKVINLYPGGAEHCTQSLQMSWVCLELCYADRKMGFIRTDEQVNRTPPPPP